MLRKLFVAARAHYRLGYNRVFGVLVGLFLVPAVIDVARYQLSGANALASALYALRAGNAHDLRLAGDVFVFLALVPPMLIGSWRIWHTNYGLNAAFRGNRIFAVILLAGCAAVGLAILWCSQLERDSGYTLDVGGPHFTFTSSLVWFASTPIFTATRWLTLVLGLSVPFLIRMLFADGPPPKFVEYKKRLRDADLRSQFYPDFGRKLIYANAGLAPRTPFVSAIIATNLNDYHRAGPATPGAEELLVKAWGKSVGRARELFSPAADPDVWDVHLAPGTSRALEIAIRSFPGVERVIYSPYEHPAENSVSEYLGCTSAVAQIRLGFKSHSVDDPWDDQLAELIELVSEAGIASARSALVISEVCWATGMVLPLDQIIERIKALFDGIDPKLHPVFIVDGAHAAGNIKRLKLLADYHAYVFSGHKWLMGQEPTGVLLTRKGHIRNPPYDAWGARLPVSTVAIGAAASLAAGLELVATIGPRKQQRSQELIEFFQKETAGKLAVVGARSGLSQSCALAVRPAVDHRWKHERRSDLQDSLKGKGIVATVILREEMARLAPDPSAGLVIRLAFHYFLSRAHVGTLARELSKLVVQDS